MKIIVIIMFCLNCGSKHLVEQSGEGIVKVDVVFEFLNQLEAICQDSFLPEDYETTALYNQAVADCVLNTLELLDLSYLWGGL